MSYLILCRNEYNIGWFDGEIIGTMRNCMQGKLMRIYFKSC